MNIGKSIIKLRVNKLGQSQRFFADQIGITQSYLSQIENGKKKPSTDLLQKIAELLKTPLPILFWFAIEETDVSPNKLEHFKFIKPTIDTMVESILELYTPAVSNSVCEDCESKSRCKKRGVYGISCIRLNNEQTDC